MGKRNRQLARKQEYQTVITEAEQVLDQNSALVNQNVEMSERLAALEFALETVDWRLLTTQQEQEFSREGLRIITDLARIYFLKNPLIKRAVLVQQLYVWGQGMSLKSATPEIQDVINAFNDDDYNKTELTGHQAHGQKEIELQTDGNLFLVAFPNLTTGRVRFRSIDFNEILDVIRNPDDNKEPWYYKRVWSQARTDLDSGTTTIETETKYYPDWKYTPVSRPATIGNYPVAWDTPVYHVKTGGFSHWAFGVSEIYAAIDWSKAYKEFLEDWASIVRAYRRFAFQLTTPGGKQGIAAAKTKLGTTMATGGTSMETNPSPLTGSTFISGNDTTLTPIRTSGATVSADDGRRIMLMVAAATGLPETFFGDVSTGARATAKTMDRPVELMMKERQTLWANIFTNIYNYVLKWAVKAPQGRLTSLGHIVTERENGQLKERVEWNKGVDSSLSIDFAPILEQDVEKSIKAIVSAATLDGKVPVGTIDLPTLSRMLLMALGEQNVDEIVDRLFPDGDISQMVKHLQQLQTTKPTPVPMGNQPQNGQQPDGKQAQQGQDNQQQQGDNQQPANANESATMHEAASDVLYDKDDVTITTEDVQRALANGKKRVGKQLSDMLMATTEDV